MTRHSPSQTQLDLFQPDAGPKPVVEPAAAPPHLFDLRRQLPATLYLGTSSWAFEGWRGLVFAPHAPKTKLARYGLAAYADYPLFRTVGLDRTYYAPIAAADFAAYASDVPDDFRFLVKAHELCTLPHFRPVGRYAERNGERNEHYLDPAYAAEHVIGPCVDGLGAKTGTMLFQFPPQHVQMLGGPQRFAERLHAFLQALPRGPLYAVEIRNTELFTSDYIRALTETETAHCFNVHPSMPPIHEQYRQAKDAAAAGLIIRWMLHPNQRYETAKTRYQPFDRLVDEDLQSRQTIATMCLEATASARTAIVIVNNKAEGSSPLTVCKLAETMARSARKSET
jgi:uncharacterized protein YecE (DUF72 family)